MFMVGRARMQSVFPGNDCFVTGFRQSKLRSKGDFRLTNARLVPSSCGRFAAEKSGAADFRRQDMTRSREISPSAFHMRGSAFAITIDMASPPVDLKHVLLVDGDQPTLGLLECWLAEAGYDVVACARFEDAKTYLAGHVPDILLAGIRLGAFNGLQLALLLKGEHPSARAIVFSDYEDPVLQAEAVRCGARFVRRPDSSATLLSCLEGPIEVSPTAPAG
jgi:PleD family two-component response regulator